MKENEKKTGSAGGNKKPHPDGYPLYPVNEDIYNKFSERQDIDPEDIARKKDAGTVVRRVSKHAAHADEASPGSDLDIPGAEADDAQEATGSEDEENNYYSLGGDEHNDLEEYNQSDGSNRQKILIALHYGHGAVAEAGLFTAAILNCYGRGLGVI